MRRPADSVSAGRLVSAPGPLRASIGGSSTLAEKPELDQRVINELDTADGLSADPAAPLGTPVTPGVRPEPPRYDLSYRDAFWRERGYEDRCDRLSLRALLPASGGRLLDIGAGFGRLADEYGAFDRVTLADASPEMRDAAREHVGADPRFEIVAAEADALPFADASFDVVVAVRLVLHLRDPLPLFREVHRVLRPGGTFIVEFPNRRHLLAVVRHLIGRQSWSPTGLEPHEYLEDHFAHQPARVQRQLRAAGLEPDAVRAVSLFRSRWLKQRVAAHTLAAIEAPFQALLGPLVPGPSVYVRARRIDQTPASSVEATRPEG